MLKELLKHPGVLLLSLIINVLLILLLTIGLRFDKNSNFPSKVTLSADLLHEIPKTPREMEAEARAKAIAAKKKAAEEARAKALAAKKKAAEEARAKALAAKKKAAEEARAKAIAAKKKAAEEARAKAIAAKKKAAEEARAKALAAKKKAAEEARAKALAAKKKAAEEARAKALAAKKKAAEEARAKALAAKKKAAEEALQKQKRLQDQLNRKQMQEESNRLEKQLQASEAVHNQKLLKRWTAEIRSRIQQFWKIPPGYRPGQSCTITVVQDQGGYIQNYKVGHCTGNALFRRSVETAILQASPLPAAPSAKIFQKTLQLTFEPEK